MSLKMFYNSDIVPSLVELTKNVKTMSKSISFKTWVPVCHIGGDNLRGKYLSVCPPQVAGKVSKIGGRVLQHLALFKRKKRKLQF